MKKSIWTLSALALLGLGMTACGGDEGDACTTSDPNSCAAGLTCNPDTLTCEAVQDRCEVLNCASNADKKFCVASYTGTKVCAAQQSCGTGKVFDDEGLCVSDSIRESCTKDSDCEGEQVCNAAGKCEDKGSSAPQYKFVRIEDLSPKPQATGQELDDPGADIDAIVLVKAGNRSGTLYYATNVVGYQRADGKQSDKSNNKIAANPDNALGQPDSFVDYPDTTNCNYYKEAYNSDTSKNEHPYVSLGGVGGYLVVEMGGAIESGDKLDILEVGDCVLKNTEKTSSTQKAQAEEVRVQISVTNDGDWKLLGNKSSAGSKGLISFDIEL